MAGLFQRLKAVVEQDLFRQPFPTTIVRTLPTLPPTSESPAMNAIFTSIFEAIPSLVLQAEQIFTTPGSGVDKAAAVTAVVAQSLPVGDSAGMQKAQNVMALAVWAMHNFGPLFAKTPAPAPAAVAPVAVASTPVPMAPAHPA